MVRVHPFDQLRLLGSVDLQADQDGFLIVADQDADQRLVRAGIDLLVRHKGGDKDKISRTGFGIILQMFPPAQAGFAADNVDYALQFPVVMSARFSTWLDADTTSPDFPGTGRWQK